MYNKAIDLLKKARKVAIFTHINPDGDALGSSIALKLALKQLKIEADVFCDDKIDKNYDFLNFEKYYYEHKNTNYDLAVSLDCPALHRMGKYKELYRKINKKMVIDHHLNNDIKANVKIVDKDAGSVGVILYRIFKLLDLEITREIATAIYTSVCSDTGCFLHSNTTSEAHLIASEVIKYGINVGKINYRLFKRKTKNKVAFFAKALNNIQYHFNNQVALIVLSSQFLKQANANYLDTMGIIDFISGIEDIKIAIVLSECSKNYHKVSFRSNKIDTTLIATHFDGGGHFAASGCQINGKTENVVNEILEVTKRQLI